MDIPNHGSIGQIAKHEAKLSKKQKKSQFLLLSETAINDHHVWKWVLRDL